MTVISDYFMYSLLVITLKYVSGKCVVIGLQSTGEARTLEQLERDDGELTDFVSTAKGIIRRCLLRKY